jgi:hypothetical protein
MSSLNKIRILENDEQKKTNPNSNEAFELGFVDSLSCPIGQLSFIYANNIFSKYSAIPSSSFVFVISFATSFNGSMAFPIATP